MPKNYYLILGVTSEASLDEIKAAFRRRARELHPDVSGLESEPFLEVQEAYAVLADPERRRRYDRELAAVARRRRTRAVRAEPMVAARPPAEPLRSVEPARELIEVSLLDPAATFHPSFEELFARFWSNFESITRPKAERLESLTVEVVLTPEEARRGGRVRVWVPTRATCPTCGGHGAVGAYECWRCLGRGALTSESPLDVTFPPGVRDGAVLSVPLSRFGIENFYLTLWFRVE